MQHVRHEGQPYHVANDEIFKIVSLLKACAKQKDLNKGLKLHAYIRQHKFLQNNSYVLSTLVSMYARCGALTQAQQVLKELPVRDVVTWTALIGGYAQHGQGEEALKCFDDMQGDGHSPDVVTFICALKACGSIGAATKGEMIHNKLVNLGMLDKDIVLGGTLVDMYARCGALVKAHEVFHELSTRNVATWNSLISGYDQHGQGEKAVNCFDSMQHEGLSPDVITFICALKACGTIRAVARGEKVHDKIVTLGLLKRDIVLGNTLVDMYARCGALAKAQQVLYELSVRDVITWNALIAGYAEQGKGEEALKCFDVMQWEGHCPNAVSFNCALKACGSIGAAAKGEKIHDEIVNLGILERNVVLGNSLMDMYTKCGAFIKAQEVLNNLSVRDMVTWNALIAGYVRQGQGEEALKCLDSMQHEGHSPNVITFTCALKACGSIGAISKGEQIHEKIVSLGMLKKDSMLGNALLDMYAKCAVLGKAEEVLKELYFQDLITWNSLIGGYAQQGQSWEVLSCFERMQSCGVRPDSTTFICVLNACSNSGLLDQAQMYISTMSSKYGTSPHMEHFCCMVDLLSHAGKLNEAFAVIAKMPSTDYLPAWLALLSVCCKQEDVKVGEFAFRCAV